MGGKPLDKLGPDFVVCRRAMNDRRDALAQERMLCGREAGLPIDTEQLAGLEKTTTTTTNTRRISTHFLDVVVMT